jgi:5-methylcytosine-specific restriction endonuclease McrA
LGGSDAPGNLQALCADCHRVKTAAESAAQIRRLRALGRRDVGRHPGLL